MASLGDMRSRIANELQIDATEFQSDIDAAIFSSINFYNDADFWFTEATPLSVVLSLTSVYPLTTLIPSRSTIRNIVLQYNQDGEDMLYRTPGEFAALESEFTGDPLYWTIYADELRVEPVPARTFTAVVWYTSQLSMTATPSAESVWTNEAEELIRLHAKVDLLTNRIKDYAEAAQIQGRLQAVLDNLGEKTVQRRGSRRLKPCL